jgi:N-acetylglucosaminyl-diphospho-decaprenol L-rhamnosyltransferase
MSARVAVVVVSYESRDDLPDCLAGIAHDPAAEVVVVDNASRDGSADLVARDHPSVRLLRMPANLGFGAACNRGAAATTAPCVMFLNPDAVLAPGALDALARVLDQEPTAGGVGPRTVHDDGTLQVSFGPALGLRAEWRQRALVRGVRRREPDALARAEALAVAATAADPDWVSGSCLLVRRSAFEQVGGFDEAFFLYEEDVDLCVRIRAAGWRVRYEPRALVRHRLGRSMAHDAGRARLEYHRSHIRYYRKHNGAAATGVLRAGLAAQSLLGWLRAALLRDGASRATHGQVLRLAVGGRP